MRLITLKGTERLAVDFLGDCPSQTYAALVKEARARQEAVGV
jgi:hypothetical protein